MVISGRLARLSDNARHFAISRWGNKIGASPRLPATVPPSAFPEMVGFSSERFRSALCKPKCARESASFSENAWPRRPHCYPWVASLAHLRTPQPVPTLRIPGATVRCASEKPEGVSLRPTLPLRARRDIDPYPV